MEGRWMQVRVAPRLLKLRVSPVCALSFEVPDRLIHSLMYM